MRRALIAVAFATVSLILAACSSAQAEWTYAPPPSEPPQSGAPSGEPASAPPSGEASAAPSAAASAAASAPVPSGAVVQVSATGVKFDQSELQVPADTPFTIEFANNDNGVPHNIQIRDASGSEVFLTDTFNGVETRTFEAPSLAAGSYQFVCTIHPNMIIDVTVQ